MPLRRRCRGLAVAEVERVVVKGGGVVRRL